ncbi:MAG TPA: NAD(P)H-dependent oxidoreductase [Candidatus Polarisedimenticolaceae bacterium]|nr:NAD(P)H-dependent oxidoreductase [Candidatus Polarisedimenticolaceae bacterium]
MMKRTQRLLVLFAHPALEKSRVNSRMVDAVRRLPGVQFHDLYEAYPDFAIDVEYEQSLLAASDVVVMQHPLYWYSTPALLKEWEDLVLVHGWAYGTGGTALAGKTMFSVITTGGGEESYCAEGYNRFSLRQLLAPIEQTAILCGMDYLPPFVVHGTHRFGEREIVRHAADYRRLIQALVDGTLDVGAARSFVRLNSDLDAVISS